MKKQIARDLLILVNDPLDLEALLAHVQERIDIHSKSLSTLDDMKEVYRIQGAIRELNRIFSLREEVIENSKNAT